MSARKLTAEEAVMLLPATIDRDRMIDALAWLGISRDVIGTFAAVTLEPARATFEVWALGDSEPRRVTVEARVR